MQDIAANLCCKFCDDSVHVLKRFTFQLSFRFPRFTFVKDDFWYIFQKGCNALVCLIDVFRARTTFSLFRAVQYFSFSCRFTLTGNTWVCLADLHGAGTTFHLPERVQHLCASEPRLQTTHEGDGVKQQCFAVLSARKYIILFTFKIPAWLICYPLLCLLKGLP